MTTVHAWGQPLGSWLHIIWACVFTRASMTKLNHRSVPWVSECQFEATAANYCRLIRQRHRSDNECQRTPQVASTRGQLRAGIIYFAAKRWILAQFRIYSKRHETTVVSKKLGSVAIKEVRDTRKCLQLITLCWFNDKEERHLHNWNDNI